MGEGEISDGEAKIYSWEKESNSRFSEYKRGRFPTEGTLNIEVSLGPWRMGRPRVDLFTNSMDRRLPVYFVPHQDPLALGVDAMLQSWEDLEVYAFPPFAMIRKVLNKLRETRNCRMTLVAPRWPQRERFPDLVQSIVEEPRTWPYRRDLITQHVSRVLH